MAAADQLERFIEAQAKTFAEALCELEGGRKQSHWMWFVFPQLRGLGRSPTANFFGLSSLAEARAFLAHPLLGKRLELAARTAMASGRSSAHDIFGSPDDLKFHSSMTLFAIASGELDSVFRAALNQFWGGALDQATLDLLAEQGDAAAHTPVE